MQDEPVTSDRVPQSTGRSGAVDFEHVRSVGNISNLTPLMTSGATNSNMLTVTTPNVID